VGRNLLIKNVTSNCVRGVDHQLEAVVEGECRDTDYRDPQLKVWKKTPVADIRREAKHSSAINLYPYVVVYCWGNSIIIRESNRNITKACALSPYRLQSSQTFHTSDLLVSHRGGLARQIELKETELLFDVSDAHFDGIDALESESRELENSFQVIDRLTNLSAEANRANVWTEIFGNPITYPVATLLLVSTTTALGVVVAMFVSCWCWRKYSRRNLRKRQRRNCNLALQQTLYDFENTNRRSFRSLTYKPRPAPAQLYRLAGPEIVEVE